MMQEAKLIPMLNHTENGKLKISDYLVQGRKIANNMSGWGEEEKGILLIDI